MTVRPAFAPASPTARASSYCGCARPSRALPNTDTARPHRARASKPSTNSERMRSARHGSVWTKAGSLPPCSRPWSACPSRSRASRLDGLHAPGSEVRSEYTLRASLSAMDFAFHGTVPPELAAFRAGLEAALVRRGYAMLETPDDATLVCNFVDAADAAAVPADEQVDVRRLVLARDRRRPTTSSAPGYPVLAEGALEPLRLRRAGRDGAVPDARAGQLRGARRPTVPTRSTTASSSAWRRSRSPTS